MEWMLLPLKRYADFEGRSRRKEYWMFQLGVALLYAVVFGVLFTIGGLSGAFNHHASSDAAPPAIFWFFIGIFSIIVVGLFIPSLAVKVRRLHDRDMSGWLILLSFIPYLGALVLFIFYCLDGTQGANRYGEDPKGENLVDVFK